MNDRTNWVLGPERDISREVRNERLRAKIRRQARHQRRTDAAAVVFGMVIIGISMIATAAIVTALVAGAIWLLTGEPMF